MPFRPVRFAARWPFLMLGLATFLIFLSAETFASLQAGLNPVLRVLIVPLWLMRTIEMMIGMGNLPGAVQLFTALPLLFLPYILADLALARLLRHSGARRHTATSG